MSTTTVGPAVLLDGPLPRPFPYGLFSVAAEAPYVGGDADGEPDRWVMGANMRPYPIDIGNGIEGCLTGTYAEKDAGTATPIPTFGAFTVYVPETCSSFGIIGYGDFTRRANAVLAAVESYHAERQLVSGAYKNDNPFLGDVNATGPDGGAVDATGYGPVESLALLEDAIGALTGRGGVIHATPSTVVAWSGNDLLVRDGQILRTVGGTPVVRGSGYIDATPAGTGALTADQQWAWATGPVAYRRATQVFMNPPTVAEALDRSDNTITYRAERDLLIAWDTVLQVAVLVDRSA
jgi:hypothetical protein